MMATRANATAAAASKETSVGALLGNLARDTSALVRQEVQLASAEMTLKAKAAARNAAFVAVGGALALASLLAFMFAAIFGLQTWLPLWASSLVVGAIVGGAGVALATTGLAAFARMQPLPMRTIATLKGDVDWVKGEIQ